MMTSMGTKFHSAFYKGGALEVVQCEDPPNTPYERDILGRKVLKQKNLAKNGLT